MGKKILGLALDLALEADLLSWREAKIASLRNEAISTLGALVLWSTPFSLSEVTSLLKSECASNLTLQIEALAAGSEAIAASLIALMSALPLASREKRG